ncbi:MAG: dihydrodipicolinate synthase family protein [Promethearchaeota archaeon]
MFTMKELLDLHGIITVLNTPFTGHGEIDAVSLRRNVSRAVDAGVAGFLVPAMASEVNKLSESERAWMVENVLDETNGRVPIIGGASANTRGERIRITRGLIDMGCDGILVNIDYENDAQYERDVLDVARLDPDLLMLQDWSFTGYGIPVPLITRLFLEVDAFKALKVEVVPAGMKYSQVLKETGGKLHVSGGWAVMQMIEGLDRGVHAFMPTGMHEIYVAIYKRYKEGDRDGALELFNRLLPVLAFSNQHLDVSIHFFKRLLHAEGIFATPRVRQPILPFDEIQQALAKHHVDYAMELHRSLD